MGRITESTKRAVMDKVNFHTKSRIAHLNSSDSEGFSDLNGFTTNGFGSKFQLNSDDFCMKLFKRFKKYKSKIGLKSK